MNLGSITIRSSVYRAFVWLILGWALFLFAKETGVWQLCFLSIALAIWGIAQDISYEGYFRPVLVFLSFTFLYITIDMAWMATSMNETMPFFSYQLPVYPDLMFTLTGEQMILSTATYAGYLIARGGSKRGLEYVWLKPAAIDSLWWVFYLVGLAALLYIVVIFGGLGAVLENLQAKYERGANNGILVGISYFAYAGILIWYKKNIWRPVWQRYGAIVALSFPLLLSGSREGMLICLIAAGYMDERIGRRINLTALVLLAICLVGFFVVYQAFRGRLENIDILTSIYKDLSMGVGYIVAVQEGILGDQTRLSTLWLTLTPVLPGFVKSFIGFPESPSSVFTHSIFPSSDATFAMGVMGEANYVLKFGWSFIYYFATGLILTAIARVGEGRSLLPLLVAAMVAGGAVRIAKGGLTDGIGTILLYTAGIIIACLVATVVIDAVKKPVAQRKRSFN